MFRKLIIISIYCCFPFLTTPFLVLQIWRSPQKRVLELFLVCVTVGLVSSVYIPSETKDLFRHYYQCGYLGTLSLRQALPRILSCPGSYFIFFVFGKINWLNLLPTAFMIPTYYFSSLAVLKFARYYRADRMITLVSLAMFLFGVRYLGAVSGLRNVLAFAMISLGLALYSEGKRKLLPFALIFGAILFHHSAVIVSGIALIAINLQGIQKNSGKTVINLCLIVASLLIASLFTDFSGVGDRAYIEAFMDKQEAYEKLVAVKVGSIRDYIYYFFLLLTLLRSSQLLMQKRGVSAITRDINTLFIIGYSTVILISGTLFITHVLVRFCAFLAMFVSPLLLKSYYSLNPFQKRQYLSLLTFLLMYMFARQLSYIIQHMEFYAFSPFDNLFSFLSANRNFIYQFL